MITEVVCFPLRKVKTTQTEQALKKTLNLLTKQEGFERASWSWQEDDDNIFWVLVDWTSIEAHQSFQKKDYYNSFVDDLDMIADVSCLQAFHTNLSLYPTVETPCNGGSLVAEICTLYFPADYSTRDKKEFENFLLENVANREEKLSTFIVFAGGWAVEKIPMSITSEESTVFFACVGWQSVAAHLPSRETTFFRDKRHLLEQAKDLEHLRIMHISGMQVGKNGHF